MLWGLVLLALGVVAAVNGFRAFGCESVSLSRAVITCHGAGVGATGGAIAGIGLVLLGVILAAAGLTGMRRSDR